MKTKNFILVTIMCLFIIGCDNSNWNKIFFESFKNEYTRINEFHSTFNKNLFFYLDTRFISEEIKKDCRLGLVFENYLYDRTNIGAYYQNKLYVLNDIKKDIKKDDFIKYINSCMDLYKKRELKTKSKINSNMESWEK